MRRKGGFFKINGREVYANATSKRWRCPECKWWRDWAEERCCACGSRRDGDEPAALPKPRVRRAGA
jgi:hypothetical protein